MWQEEKNFLTFYANLQRTEAQFSDNFHKTAAFCSLKVMPRRKTAEDVNIDAPFDLQPSTSAIKKLRTDSERYMLLDETIVNVLLDTESDNSDFDFDISTTDMSNEESEESDQEFSHSASPEPGTSSVIWNTTRPITSNIPFAGNPGLITSASSEPIDYFFLLANDKFFDLVLRETNVQGHKLRSGSPSKSRMKNFKDITREDLEVFLGLIFLAANVQAPSFAHYWTKNDLYVFPPFSNAMSRDKFQSILCSLHFSTSTGKQDPLHKVQPLLDYFNDTMREVHYPGKNLSLDECMLYSQQNVRSKSRKRGVKFYMLTEPDGLVLRTLIDCGVREPEGHDRIVKTLLADFLQVGHSVFLYNFYTSVPLVRELLLYKTYCTGILGLNDKNNPADLVHKKIGRGEVDARYTPEGVCVLKWRDKRDALMISSEYKADIMKVQSKSGKHVQKPELVEKYNKYMNGTDRADQFLGYYACERKTVRWRVKIGLHMFHVMLNNAYVLYRKHARTKMTLLKFREAVIDKLIYKNRPRLDVIPKPAGQNVHLPRMSGHEGGKKIRKRCRVCYSKGLRKEGQFYCPACPDKPGLCLDICFAEYHNYIIQL